MRQSNFATILLSLLTAVTLHGQENSIRLDGGPSWKGLSIRFSPRVEPDTSGASNELGGTVIDLRGRVIGQRFIDDPAHKRSFGYDVRLEPSANGNSAQIRIEPLHAAEHAVQSGWTRYGLPAGLPKYPVIPDLKVGDTVVLDLLFNPATGQKIVDYLTLVRSGGPATEVAHDFSLADVQLSLNLPHFTGTSAAFVWVYLKGHGRFILSLFPNEKFGFQKNGIVQANTVTLHDGSTVLRLNCDGPVAPGQGPYNLYVVHEPSWRPSSQSDSIQVGSADDAAWIVGKH
jgi:hypothetical protein